MYCDIITIALTNSETLNYRIIVRQESNLGILKYILCENVKHSYTQRETFKLDKITCHFISIFC